MSVMIKLSLLLNLAVLTPICVSHAVDAAWVREAYGGASPARDILMSVYFAIGISSAALLVFDDPKYVAALLFIQIVYKATTPISVGSFVHPVVVSNLAIAAFHSVTLWFIWQAQRAASSS